MEWIWDNVPNWFVALTGAAAVGIIATAETEKSDASRGFWRLVGRVLMFVWLWWLLDTVRP